MMGCLWGAYSGDKRLMSKFKNLKIWKILSLSLLQKKRKCVLKRTPRVWVDRYFKEIAGM